MKMFAFSQMNTLGFTQGLLYMIIVVALMVTLIHIKFC